MTTTPTTPKTDAPKGSRPAKRAEAAAAAQAPAPEPVATPAPAVGPKPRTLAVTEGTCTCRDCGRERPVTKFPTKAPLKDGTVVRDDRCRECRDATRDANKVAAAATAARLAAIRAEAAKAA